MSLNKFKITITLFTISILIFTLSACKEDALTESEDHFEAEGMVFYIGNSKIVEIFRGVTSDTFFVPLNNMTDTIKAKFLDSERNVITPYDYTLKPMSYEISDTAKVSIIQHPDKKGSYEFIMQGKRAGVTNVEFFLLHEGHIDFRSGKIPVSVR